MSDTYEQPHALQDVPNETTATNLPAISELAPARGYAAHVEQLEIVRYKLADIRVAIILNPNLRRAEEIVWKMLGLINEVEHELERHNEEPSNSGQINR